MLRRSRALGRREHASLSRLPCVAPRRVGMDRSLAATRAVDRARRGSSRARTHVPSSRSTRVNANSSAASVIHRPRRIGHENDTGLTRHGGIPVGGRRPPRSPDLGPLPGRDRAWRRRDAVAATSRLLRSALAWVVPVVDDPRRRRHRHRGTSIGVGAGLPVDLLGDT